MKEVTASLDELGQVVASLEELAPANAIIFLTGDLAAGKTTLTQMIAQYKGCASAVTSPTFSLQHCYDESLFHYDLYRIGFEELASLGLLNEFERPGWHLVEWGDDALKSLLLSAGFTCFEVTICTQTEGDTGTEKRIYTLRELHA